MLLTISPILHCGRGTETIQNQWKGGHRSTRELRGGGACHLIFFVMLIVFSCTKNIYIEKNNGVAFQRGWDDPGCVLHALPVT